MDIGNYNHFCFGPFPPHLQAAIERLLLFDFGPELSEKRLCFTATHADTENDVSLKAKYGDLLFQNIFTQLLVNWQQNTWRLKENAILKVQFKTDFYAMNA